MVNDMINENKNVPLEIERKYLVKMPDMSIVKEQENYRDYEMVQMYLADTEEFKGVRIRKSICSGKTTCKKTMKRDITPIKRVEIEEDITVEEFERLSSYRAPEYMPIHKHRHSFSYKYQTVELDIYDFWQDRATVEVEMESEEQTVVLPDFIEVIREVTEDLRYRNRSLAKQVVYDKI